MYFDDRKLLLSRLVGYSRSDSQGMRDELVEKLDNLDQRMVNDAKLLCDTLSRIVTAPVSIAIYVILSLRLPSSEDVVECEGGGGWCEMLVMTMETLMQCSYGVGFGGAGDDAEDDGGGDGCGGDDQEGGGNVQVEDGHDDDDD
eukprot:759307-Hanusia_phi.AAC.8